MVRTSHVTENRRVSWRATTHERYCGFGRPFARISLGAIFAGTVVALAIQLMLTLIGGAIGLSTASSARIPNRNPRLRH